MHIIKTVNGSRGKWIEGFLRHLYHGHVFESSATLSYYFLFSVFPLAIFFSASFSTLNLSVDSQGVLTGFVPDRILEVLENYLEEVAYGNTFSLILLSSCLTVYSLGKALQTMRRKFRAAYGLKNRSQSVWQWMISFVFVCLLLISFYAMLFIIVAGNYIFRYFLALFPLLEKALPSFQFLRFFAVTCYLFFVLLGLYYALPGIKLQTKDVLPGTLFSLVSWVLLSYLFSLYLDRFSNFQKLYGSLGAMIALLTWLFLINLILLTGAALNSFYFVNKGSAA